MIDRQIDRQTDKHRQIVDGSLGNKDYINQSISLPFQDSVFSGGHNRVAMSKSKSEKMMYFCGAKVIRCGYKSHLKT